MWTEQKETDLPFQSDVSGIVFFVCFFLSDPNGVKRWQIHLLTGLEVPTAVRC